MSRSLLRTFEYQTARVGHELTEAQFEAMVRLNDRSEERLFDVGHRRVTFRQFVGFLQVGDLGIEVLPKIDRDTSVGNAESWHSFLLEMLRVVTGLRLRTVDSASQELVRSNLLDILAREFAEECTLLAHAGLAKGYRAKEENQTAFRGRLLVEKNLRVNLGRADRIYSRVTVFDADTKLNRLLATGLDALSSLALGAATTDEVRRAQAMFDGIPALTSIAGVFEHLRLGRSTLRYSKALTLGRMILEQRMPGMRVGGVPVFTLMFDMNVLWEGYVAAMLRRVARGTTIQVDVQSSTRFWKAGSATRLARPDIVLRDRLRGGVILVADTKWKRLDVGGPKDGDLRQMFAYGHLFDSPVALLLYPAASRHPRRIEGLFDRGCRCDARELALLNDADEVAKATFAEELHRLVVLAQAVLRA